MHTYQVFGHLLLSDIQFPELVPSEGKPDIFLRRTKIDEPWEKCDNEIYIFKRIPTGILLTWPKYGRFLIRENFEIDVEFAQNDEDQITRFIFLGPVLGLVFHQKNYKIFHASAVALPQGAVAFLGKKGHGKSTLAAAFALQGNPLITDDVLVLKTEGKKVLALPGFPFVKLWPQSLEAIGQNTDQYPRFNPGIDKRILKFQDKYIQTPVELRSIFVLGFSPTIECQALTPKKAFQHLMPHWYGTQFESKLLAIMGLERQFQECVSIVERTPIYLLKRPISLDLLPEVCRVVEWQNSRSQ